MRNTLLAILTLTAAPALAQQAEPPASDAPPDAPAAESQPAPAAPEEPSLDERMTNAEGKVTSLEEQNAETQTVLSALTKLKLSGYVQARYQYQESLDDTGAGGFSRFTVRRGRLKTTYTTDWAQMMLQIDAVPDTGVTVRDAEATFYVPGMKKKLSLTLGQMKWPFGFEAVQSSSDREIPERTRVVRAFLPDERDRGAKFSGEFLKGRMTIDVGVFDGDGLFNQGFIGSDNDKEKDIIGRAGFDLKWLSGGISGWYGHSLGRRPTDTYRVAYDRNRVALDAQLYLDVLPFGGTSIKAEYIKGNSYWRSSGGTKVEQLGVPASGWYGLVVQNVSLTNAVAVRYDYFDPENGQPNLETADGKPGSNNAVGTLAVALLHHFSENLKATLAYELPMTAAPGAAEDPHDNLLTFQLQARY
ncbi:porin [Pyxidicoccus trucidator]|uniref:porin n=1 Tax=Pyxidicoccus trucidator TaxID=2709662 RepID=UPI0013DA27B2|nr:porin [Pyxidicoccus trucidator]